MTEQHDAPEGGAVQPVAWRAWSESGQAWRLYHEDLGVDADLTRWEPLYPAPPAPSGLGDAVRAYLAEVDAKDALNPSGHLAPQWEAYAIASHDADIARAALDATLSGQQGGAVPAGDDEQRAHEAEVWVQLVEMLKRDHERMRKAGTTLAEAALYTIGERDGLHRLALAASAWAKAVADEGDRARLAEQPAPAGTGTFALGDRVEKTKGSSWRGYVVGTYSTSLTPRGYAVESEREPGSVQIYPEAALRPAPAGMGDADRAERLRPGIETALQIVEVERETISISSPAYQRLSSVYRTLRAALDGACGQETTP